MAQFRPSTDDVFSEAVQAQIALGEFIWRTSDKGDLDLDRLALDTTDPLVAEVEAFVKGYRKLYGDPVK